MTDVANQKYCLIAGMQWELNMWLIQHDTDQLAFDEMAKLSISLIFKVQLANQNRPKNYNITPFPNNIYVSPSIANSMITIPSQQKITTIYISFAQFHPDQNDIMDLSATNKKPRMTAEKKEYRFENNLCLYCGKPGHKAIDYKILSFYPTNPFHNRNFCFTNTSPIHDRNSPNDQFKINVNICIQSFAKTIMFFIFVLVLTPANSVKISNKHLVSRCINY